MNEAARAIREANPCVEVVAGVALAKSERRSFSGVTNEKLPEHVRRLAGLDSEEEARHAFLDDDDGDEYEGEEEEEEEEEEDEEDEEDWDWGGMFMSGSDDPPD